MNETIIVLSKKQITALNRKFLATLNSNDHYEFNAKTNELYHKIRGIIYTSKANHEISSYIKQKYMRI